MDDSNHVREQLLQRWDSTSAETDSNGISHEVCRFLFPVF
jgi:hypothetical protein